MAVVGPITGFRNMRMSEQLATDPRHHVAVRKAAGREDNAK